MATATLAPVPAAPAPPALTPRRWTLAEYHRMIEVGILGEDDRCEFLNGVIVDIMPPNPPHAYVHQTLHELLLVLLRPHGFFVNSQDPVALPDDEPQPDVFVARPPRAQYAARHPGAADLVLVAEVADSSVRIDTRVRLPMYAAAGIPEYWIVNLIDRRVEVYTGPSAAGYASRQDYGPGEAVPVAIGGAVVGTVAVDDVLP